MSLFKKFKSFEKQVEEAGFKLFGTVSCNNEKRGETLTDKTNLANVAERIKQLSEYKNFIPEEVYLRVVKKRKRPYACNCEQCLSGYDIEIYVTKEIKLC